MYREERTVEITQDEYSDLLENTILYRLLLETIFGKCGLSWDKKSLTFDDKALSNFLEITIPQRYNRALNELKEEENNE